MPVGYGIVTADRIVMLVIVNQTPESIQHTSEKIAEVGYSLKAIDCNAVIDITRQENFDLMIIDLTTSSGNFGAYNAKLLRLDVMNLPVYASIRRQDIRESTRQSCENLWSNLLNLPLPSDIISHLLNSIFHQPIAA